MSQEPYKLLTLVIPTYNMEKYLTKCLESVTAPCIPPTLEVIVVNDGSKDRSLDIMKAFQPKKAGYNPHHRQRKRSLRFVH